MNKYNNVLINNIVMVMKIYQYNDININVNINNINEKKILMTIII